MIMLPYLGGKYKQSKWMYKFIPKDFDEYAEVFGGAFWFYIRTDIYKQVKKAYYNDFNRLMVNLMESVKPQHLDEFFKYINDNKIVSQNETTFEEFRDKIIELNESKTINNFEIPNSEYAVMYSYVLSQLFSGYGIKKNAKMFHLKGKYVSKFDTFLNRIQKQETKDKMEKVETSNLDFEDFIKKNDKQDIFMYFDPPYYNVEQKYYSFHDFGKDDHKRLADAVKKMKGKFMISYYNFPELEEWFPKDKYHWVEKGFKIRAAVQKNKTMETKTEVLIMNYTPSLNTILEEW
jgi:DNA adenine methylase